MTTQQIEFRDERRRCDHMLRRISQPYQPLSRADSLRVVAIAAIGLLAVLGWVL